MAGRTGQTALRYPEKQTLRTVAAEETARDVFL